MTTRNLDPATIHGTIARDLTESVAALPATPTATLATAHATLALAAEQRTANLIAEATRLQDLLVELPDALKPGDADRIRRILADLGALIRDRLSLDGTDIDSLTDAVLAVVGQGVTAERWGVYSYNDARWYLSDPPTREAAERNHALLRADGEVCDVFPEHVGRAMQNAVAHARHRAAARPSGQEGS